MEQHDSAVKTSTVSGKEQKFEALYRDVYKDLYRFAYFSLQNAEDAEDAVSEAVTDALASFHSLRNPEKFKGWIFKILSAKCKRRMKQYYHRPIPLESTQELPDNGPDLAERIDLFHAFGRLSEEERLILSCTVFGGYTSREAARILRMNANTVRSKQSRALEKLRAQLSQDSGRR